ncbi:endonuclease/exonuclease/phosphatase family protein [Sulfuriroseicoccus oceanibius]|uniref:Endonuclease/exonuclease/phosphatase family protein n=1 Tax=Sulfuriroseicoccus oceanibius TaxID=2707525 RepID=A0A6B3LAQ7_9BACT|nr:endonuclease/exonuclease/phosphatase family protein [Sulfuriroseicoccus oceanibius]QQL45184.1 endonuclease/exonuclease/phosphatase family protein [Sulfuriroseicoccus oceanibius]
MVASICRITPRVPARVTALALTLWLTLCSIATATEPLTVTSYNIRHSRGNDGQVNLERIANVLKAHPSDFVALQEVDREVDRSGKVSQAAKLGEALGMSHSFAKFMDIGGGQYGLAVLSRHPILETHVHRLPDGAEPRVALEIITQPEGSPTPLSFVCVHLDWTREDLRLSQINTLKKALEKRTHPVILAGDFNAEPNSTTLEVVRAMGSIVPKNGSPLTWPADQPQQELDYIATIGLPTEGVTSTVINDATASDHRPVKAALPLPASSGE